jgi:DNA repair protein SbcC/Rad50
MKLKELEIRLLPGLDQTLSVSFDPHTVNVVTGPNASGKSSLIRAVRALLYPDQLTDFCHLRGQWLRGDQLLECERRGNHVSWTEDGKPVTRPPLPGAESLGAFLISSEDLASLGATDQHISSQLRTMLAGGYDLDAIVSEGPLAARPRPQKLARELSRLASQVSDKESEYARLHEELAAVGDLDQELAASTDAAARLRACEDALALAETIARRDAIEQTLIKEYPGGMDRLRGDETARIDQINEQIGQREKELAVTHGVLKKTRASLEKTGTVDPHALEALQSELSDQRDRLTELERRMEEQADLIEQLDAATALAARRLGSEQPGQVEQLDQAALEELEKLVDRVQVLREQIRNLTAELTRTHVSKNLTGRSQTDLRNARQALQRWLECSNLSPLEAVLWGGLSSSALIATWRLISVQAVSLSPELFLMILLSVGIPAGLLVNFAVRWRDLERARADYRETEIEQPLGWTESEVEARLARLDLELESATRHEISQARAQDVRDQLNLQRTSLETARDRLRTFAADRGLSSDARLETGFQLWCRHLHDWQQQHLKARAARQQMTQLELRYKTLQTQTGELLARHGMSGEKATSSRDLAGLIHLLSPRMRRNAELHNEVQANQHRIEELQADIARLERGRDQVFESAGVKPNDTSTLINRIEGYESWRDLEQQRRDCSLEVARLEKRLGSEKSLLSQAHQQQREALEKLHEELAARVAQRDHINRRIAEIQTRHGELIKRRELESLTSDYETQRLALEEELDHQLNAAAASVLIEDVRAAHQADNEPAALARAGQWFEQFTRHHYRLLFEGQSFIALDTRDRRRRAITELSTGTRVQLLLAVRLAWIEQAEQRHEPLPVFLDEVLTTTDPDRYKAVVESVQEIARAGRQMFYMTAQTDDAQAWSEWAGDGPSPFLIDMAEVRRGDIEPLQYSMPIGQSVPARIPDPDAFGEPLEWAQAAGVDGIDPWRDAGAIHAFHMLHDRLDLAARLLKLDLVRLGEVEGFLAADKAGQLLEKDDQELIKHRIAATRALMEDWQQRHDRPVDESDLHASGLISENFLPRVCQLNEELNGDPRALIEGLRTGRVSRFRSDVTDQLEHWLEDQGYIHPETDQSRLTAADISLQVGIEPEEVSDLRIWLEGAVKAHPE